MTEVKPTKEVDLYSPIAEWFARFLTEVSGAEQVDVFDSHNAYLSRLLKSKGYHETIRNSSIFDLKVDVAGVLKKREKAGIILIEAKISSLCLQDLGQIIGYSRIIDPWQAVLLGTGISSELNRFLVAHNRTDLLSYGNSGKRIKIGVWDIERSEPKARDFIPIGSMAKENFIFH